MPPGAAAARRRLLLTFGSGPHGCLGLGSLSTALAPTVVAGPLAGVDVVQVSCGGAHTALVDGEGYAWTFGLDDRGQLGRGGDPRLPGEVLLPEPVVAVAAGGRRTVFVGRSGRVWEAGDAGPQGDGILGMRRREAGGRGVASGCEGGSGVVIAGTCAGNISCVAECDCGNCDLCPSQVPALCLGCRMGTRWWGWRAGSGTRWHARRRGACWRGGWGRMGSWAGAGTTGRGCGRRCWDLPGECR